MVDRHGERTTFTAVEADEIRRLLDDLNHARRAVQRMSIARQRHMQLGIAEEPDAQPTRAQFEELVISIHSDKLALGVATGFRLGLRHDKRMSIAEENLRSIFVSKAAQVFPPISQHLVDARELEDSVCVEEVGQALARAFMEGTAAGATDIVAQTAAMKRRAEVHHERVERLSPI